jgi:hypothetical protein
MQNVEGAELDLLQPVQRGANILVVGGWSVTMISSNLYAIASLSLDFLSASEATQTTDKDCPQHGPRRLAQVHKFQSEQSLS